MNIVVYGNGDATRATVGALRLTQHKVAHLSRKYFKAEDIPPSDIAILIECGNECEIMTACIERNIRVFTLSADMPEFPGYPVAVFSPFSVGDYTMWGFLNQSIPDTYRNPESAMLICSCYPSAPMVIEEYPREKPPLARATEMFHAESFKQAPRVWIIGGGPSLRDFDWSLLEGEVVIGANRAFEQPNVGITLTIDPLFERLSHNGDLGHESRQKWREYPGVKIYAVNEQNPPRGNDVAALYRAHDTADVMPPRLDNIGLASNSGYGAVKFAWAAGARDIYCLGFDMSGENGLQAWFHDGYPEVYTDDSTYPKYRAEMDSAAPFVEADGVNVTICGPTALRAFPTITLAEAAAILSRKPSRPVVCGFYTRGTRYKQEAEAMARSAVAFGLDVELVDVANLGDWKANTDQKPEAIRFALDCQMPGNCIAFIDADARFRSYPVLLDWFASFDSDLGLSYFDWDRFPNDPRAGRELSSAVMLLNPTAAVFALLDQWIARVADSSGQWEQRVLQDLLTDYTGPPLKTMELPMNYNQIFDDMASLGLPVIEQMQASRRLKGEVAA